jgi:hypothetical protein
MIAAARHDLLNIVGDGHADEAPELIEVSELAQEPSILHVLLERAERVELVGVDVIGQLASREEQMDGLAHAQSTINFFDSARYGGRRRRAKPRVEQGKHDVRVVDALRVDQLLGMRAKDRHGRRLPPPRLKEHRFLSAVLGIPLEHHLLDGVPGVRQVRRGRD